MTATIYVVDTTGCRFYVESETSSMFPDVSGAEDTFVLASHVVRFEVCYS